MHTFLYFALILRLRDLSLQQLDRPVSLSVSPSIHQTSEAAIKQQWIIIIMAPLPPEQKTVMSWWSDQPPHQVVDLFFPWPSSSYFRGNNNWLHKWGIIVIFWYFSFSWKIFLCPQRNLSPAMFLTIIFDHPISSFILLLHIFQNCMTYLQNCQ